MKAKAILAVAFSLWAFFAHAADRAKPVAEKTTLTLEELQESLGITTWRVQIPVSFGERPHFLFEYYVDGERTGYSGSVHVLRADKSREILCSIREDEKSYRRFVRWDGGSERGGFPILPEELSKITPKDARSSTTPEVTDDDIVLMRVRYYEFKNSDGPKKLLGEVLLRIAKDTKPRVSKDDAKDK